MIDCIDRDLRDVLCPLVYKLIEQGRESITVKEMRRLDELSKKPEVIERLHGVCGGRARVAGTRIPVWVLEVCRRSGTTNAKILEAYPSLNARQLDNAFRYVEEHTEEIEQDIRDQDEETPPDTQELAPRVLCGVDAIKKRLASGYTEVGQTLQSEYPDAALDIETLLLRVEKLQAGFDAAYAAAQRLLKA